MKLIKWENLKELGQMFAPSRREPTQQAARIVAMQCNIVFPARAGVLAVVLYYLASTGGFENLLTPRKVVLDALQFFFLIYVLCNATAWSLFLFRRRLASSFFRWLVFALGLLDGLFMVGLTFLTGGFESFAFWVFPGLIVLNAMSIPLEAPQLLLNLLLSLLYLSAGILNATFPASVLRSPPQGAYRPAAAGRTESAVSNAPPAFPSAANLATRSNQPRAAINELPYENLPEENLAESGATEPRLLRLCVLWLLAVCCYGVQVLAERQRRLEEEAHEMGLRQGQLRSAGRLAAEFAHQIKNPLAIINNAAYSLQRALKEGRGDVTQHLQIIQEEIQRSDKIVTQIMGYAQLNEGHVERLNLAHELSLAVAQVFPRAAQFPVKIECRCEPDLPPLLMQRNHLDEILVNILQNARDALGQTGGKIFATARRLTENLIEIAISNTGPEIPADKLERIFEAHYTTKEKGTGLGLAIVKHNVELYAGTIRAESRLGKGVRFVLVFPAKTVINPDQKFQTS